MPDRRKNGKRTRRSAGSLSPTQTVSDADHKTTIPAMFAAGRDPAQPFQDLRSNDVPRKRTKTKNWKYYNFEVVKPGQLDQPHHASSDTRWWPFLEALPAETPVVTMTKKQLYDEAQLTAPIDRHRHHACPDKKSKDQRRKAERQEVAAREEAQWWNQHGIEHDICGYHRWGFKRCNQPGNMIYDEELRDDLNVFCCSYCWDELWNVDPGEYNANGELYDAEAAYDLGLLVEAAMAGADVSSGEPEWFDIVGDEASSPELDWVEDDWGASEEEDFELV